MSHDISRIVASPMPSQAATVVADRAPAPVAAVAAPPAPNPRLRLDPALGMVVLEFRSGPGVPARSIPSTRELAAYRAAALIGAPRQGETPDAPVISQSG